MTMNKMNLSFLQDGDIRNVAYIHSLPNIIIGRDSKHGQSLRRADK